MPEPSPLEPTNLSLQAEMMTFKSKLDEHSAKTELGRQETREDMQRLWDQITKVNEQVGANRSNIAAMAENTKSMAEGVHSIEVVIKEAIKTSQDKHQEHHDRLSKLEAFKGYVVWFLGMISVAGGVAIGWLGDVLTFDFGD